MIYGLCIFSNRHTFYEVNEHKYSTHLCVFCLFEMLVVKEAILDFEYQTLCNAGLQPNSNKGA